MTIKIVSSDLNGTLVHQHTMSDMIQKYVGEEEFQKANAVFKKQTSGTATMEEAFGNAGPLTRGLTLRQAIEYANDEMKYVAGFHEFVDALAAHDIPFVINSTGYSVTIAAIRSKIGKEKVHGSIGNRLIFGSEEGRELNERELEELVFAYSYSGDKGDKTYDRIRAVGKVELGIIDEDAKANLLFEYAKKHFPEIKLTEILHLGDTIGDGGGIYNVAKAGGVGVAFNYNETLEKFLRKKIAEDGPLGNHIHFVDPKGPNSDLMKVWNVIR